MLERLIRKPRELCLDARDKCAACGKPIIAPANQCEELFKARDFAKHAHDIESVSEIEQCTTVGALGIVQAFGDEVAERR